MCILIFCNEKSKLTHTRKWRPYAITENIFTVTRENGLIMCLPIMRTRLSVNIDGTR